MKNKLRRYTILYWVFALLMLSFLPITLLVESIVKPYPKLEPLTYVVPVVIFLSCPIFMGIFLAKRKILINKMDREEEERRIIEERVNCEFRVGQRFKVHAQNGRYVYVINVRYHRLFKYWEYEFDFNSGSYISQPLVRELMNSKVISPVYDFKPVKELKRHDVFDYH